LKAGRIGICAEFTGKNEAIETSSERIEQQSKVKEQSKTMNEIKASV
jgi:hypothetical protein